MMRTRVTFKKEATAMQTHVEKMVVKGTHVTSLIASLHGDQVEGWNGMMLLWHPCGCTNGTMWAVNPMDAHLLCPPGHM